MLGPPYSVCNTVGFSGQRISLKRFRRGGEREVLGAVAAAALVVGRGDTVSSEHGGILQWDPPGFCFGSLRTPCHMAVALFHKQRKVTRQQLQVWNCDVPVLRQVVFGIDAHSTLPPDSTPCTYASSRQVVFGEEVVLSQCDSQASKAERPCCGMPSAD